MAVVVYHIHVARPVGFAEPNPPNNHVIRLLLLPSAEGTHGVWLFRNRRWGPGRFYIVPEGTNVDFDRGQVVWP